MTPHESIYSVYIHTNKINGMKYVGCTGIDPQKRWKYGYGYSNGQTKFFNAIKEFGWNNFDHEIIKTNLSKEEALELEEKLIKENNIVENGYNSAFGGKHNYLSVQSKKKLSEQRMGENNPNYKAAKERHIKTKHNNNYRPKRIKYTQEEKKQHYRDSKLGEKNPNYNKHAWNFGKKMTKEQTQKMRDAYTNERRELVRQRHLGGKNPQAKKVLCIDSGIIYDTIIEAAKANNISERAISDCCNGKVKNPKIKFCFIKEGD